MLLKSFRLFSQNSIKEVAWKALEEYKTFVFEVDSITTWLERVMKNPSPVVLQAFANWSIPCRKLTPILSKKTLECEGKFHYARLDIEEVPDLATALQVTRVPSLFLLNKGNSINKLEGIITEEALQEFIDDAKLLSGLSSDETIFKGMLLAAEEFIQEKKYDEAIRSYTEAQTSKDFSKKYQHEVWLGLLKCYYGKGDLANAEKLRSEIPKTPDPVSKDLQDFLTEIQTAQQLNLSKAQEFEVQKKEIEQALTENPSNPELLNNLALLHHKHLFHEKALEICLDLITLEKSFKGLGQKSIVAILNDLGPSHVLTKPTRKRLQRLHSKFSV